MSQQNEQIFQQIFFPIKFPQPFPFHKHIRLHNVDKIINSTRRKREDCNVQQRQYSEKHMR